MPVDIHQLPIPDWGLLCPGCRYPLVGLPSHRCPECGLALRMDEIVPTWAPLRPPEFTGRELPVPDWDLHCRACKAPLTGAASHDCPACGRPCDPDEHRPQRPWFVVDEALARGLSLVIVALELDAAQIPYHPQRNTGRLDAILGRFAPGPTLLVPSEYSFDVREVVRRARAAAQTAAGPDRPCPHCGELCPPNFQLCWNCQASLATGVTK